MAVSIITQFRKNQSKENKSKDSFSKLLMLSIAYAASIGGMATLIGTPPNLVFAGFVQKTYGIDISFWQWMPLVIAMIISGAVGTWFGIKLLKSMSGDKFERIFRVVLTLLTLQLGWQGIKILLH